MKNIVSSVLVLGILGLVVGYFLFAKVGNSYVDVQVLIAPGESMLQKFGNTLRGVEEIRRKILISGGAGAVLGLVIGMVRR